MIYFLKVHMQQSTNDWNDKDMKKIRYYIAMTAAKLSILALKILGRNASYLPGKIALRISKDFIGQLTPLRP